MFAPAYLSFEPPSRKYHGVFLDCHRRSVAVAELMHRQVDGLAGNRGAQAQVHRLDRPAFVRIPVSFFVGEMEEIGKIRPGGNVELVSLADISKVAVPRGS